MKSGLEAAPARFDAPIVTELVVFERTNATAILPLFKETVTLT